MKAIVVALLAAGTMSEEALRFQAVNKQGIDTRCGVAVCSSVLALYYGIDVREEELYEAMVFSRLGPVTPESGAAVSYVVNFKTMSDALQKYGVASISFAEIPKVAVG